MRLHLEFAIRWLFLFILQASLTASDDMCSSTTYSYSWKGNKPSLSLMIKDNILPADCSCKMTDPSTFTCSFYTNCLACLFDDNWPTCAVRSCPCAKVVNLTINPTCISASITTFNCLPAVSDEPLLCQSLTQSRLNFSTNTVMSSCQTDRKNDDLVITIQPITIDEENDHDASVHEFTKGQCTASTATPNASSTTFIPRTSISSSVATTSKIEHLSNAESTPKPETTARPGPTFVSGSMTGNMTTAPPQNSNMMSYDSNEKDRHIGIGVGVGVGLGGGILLIIAIIIVILIFRRRAESHKLRADNTTQPTADAAVAASAPSDTSYESYRVPVIAPYDNATNGVTASGYQTITYDSEPVGESNDGYTEIREPEEASNHNGYADCRIGRNEVYSMYHEMGQDHDNISETPSTNIENETTVIDNDLYG